MQFNRLADELQSFLTCLSHGHAPREVWHIGAEGRVALLNDDDVFHGHFLSFLQPRLLPHTCQRSRRNVHAGLPCYRNRSRFRWMPKLSMASVRANQTPTICLKCVDDIAYLHRARSM